MANMSYCRFQNTVRDLRDCVFAMEDIDEMEANPPHRDEIVAAETMRGLCERYIEAYDAWKGVNEDDEE